MKRSRREAEDGGDQGEDSSVEGLGEEEDEVSDQGGERSSSAAEDGGDEGEDNSLEGGREEDDEVPEKGGESSRREAEDGGHQGEDDSLEALREEEDRVSGTDARGASRSQAELDDQLQHYADGFVISSYFGPLPGKNPFWKDSLAHQQTVRYDLRHRANRDRNPPPLRLLGQTNLTNEVRNSGKALRLFAQRVFFRSLKISDLDIGNSTMAVKLGCDSQLYGRWTRGISTWQKDYQHKMLSFIKLGLTNCVLTLGGTKKWASSKKEQREAVYNAYWNQDGKYMTLLFFRPVIEAIDLDGIFAGTDADRRKWQRYVKTIFMWVCEDTYKLRLEGNKETIVSKVMASNLRQMPWCGVMSELDLGDVDNVPVVVGAPNPQNKRARLQPVVGEERVLADI